MSDNDPSPFTLPESITQVQTVFETPAGLPNVRQFDSVALNKEINDAVSCMKPGETVVALGRVDLEGAHLTIVGKLPDKLVDKIPGKLNWTVYADKPWSGDWDAGVGVRWSI